MFDFLIHKDQQLFNFLNSHNNPTMDVIMEFVSGRFSWLPLYIFLVGFIIYKYQKRALLILLFIGLLILCADQISVHCFKNIFERLRPCHFLQNVHIVNNHCGGQFGFVSSHATNVFAVAVFFSQLFKQLKWVKYVLLPWAILVAYSRVYLGVHYPLDIIGGALLGSLIAIVVFRIYKVVNSKI